MFGEFVEMAVNVFVLFAHAVDKVVVFSQSGDLQLDFFIGKCPVVLLERINIPGEKDDDDPMIRTRMPRLSPREKYKKSLNGFFIPVYLRKPNSLMKMSAIPIGAINLRIKISNL